MYQQKQTSAKRLSLTFDRTSSGGQRVGDSLLSSYSQLQHRDWEILKFHVDKAAGGKLIKNDIIKGK